MEEKIEIFKKFNKMLAELLDKMKELARKAELELEKEDGKRYI